MAERDLGDVKDEVTEEAPWIGTDLLPRMGCLSNEEEARPRNKGPRVVKRSRRKMPARRMGFTDIWRP